MLINVCKNTKLFVSCLLAFSFCLCTSSIQAQNSDDITFDDKSFKVGAMASPNGFGFFYRHVEPYSKGNFKVLDIGLTGIRSVKEKSILNQRVGNTTPYVYGKINRLYALRPMAGVQRTLSERNSKNSVGINAFAIAGPTLGFLKPIFVDVLTVDPNIPNNYISVSRRYEPFTMDPITIDGYSSFDKGIGETKLVLGGSIKSGVEFNWGNYTSIFRSLEVGFMVDYFPSRPAIMHGIKNKVLYSSFYISFALGEHY